MKGALERSTLLAIALQLVLTRNVHAQHEQERTASSTPLFVRLAPSPQTRERERANMLERRIAQTLASLPEVVTATVQLTLPPNSDVALDRPLPSPRAALLLHTRGRGPSDTELAAVVESTLPGLPPTELTVLRRELPVPAREKLVSVGPFRVEVSSAHVLRLTLALLFGTNALLALFVLAPALARSRRPH